MATLILRNVPPELHRQLKKTAAENRRSMNQQAILILETWLRAEVAGASAPTLGDPSADDTIDGADG